MIIKNKIATILLTNSSDALLIFYSFESKEVSTKLLSQFGESFADMWIWFMFNDDDSVDDFIVRGYRKFAIVHDKCVKKVIHTDFELWGLNFSHNQEYLIFWSNLAGSLNIIPWNACLK